MRIKICLINFNQEGPRVLSLIQTLAVYWSNAHEQMNIYLLLRSED